jgi:hypothetical protein
MTFRVRFYPTIQEQIAGWGLPVEVLREFYLRVADDLEHASAPQRVVMAADGMQHVVVVQESATKSYVFRLWLTRNDMDFQVQHVVCTGIEEGRRVFWSSNRPH